MGWIGSKSYWQGPEQNYIGGCPDSSLEYPPTLDKASSHKNREAYLAAVMSAVTLTNVPALDARGRFNGVFLFKQQSY